MTELQFDIPALVSQFHRDGYLILRNVLPDERVARLNLAVDELIAGEPESLSYNWYNSVERHPAFADLIDEPALLPLMVNLLGFNIQLHISHLTVRRPNPGDSKTESQSFINWHQDGPHPQFPRIHGLTSTYYMKACYILSDMSEPDRGNTKIISGSHLKADFAPVQTNVDVPVEGELQVCGKQGDVFIFPQNLWHAGAPNRSGFTRRQLFFGYSPIWMRPIDYHRASDALLANASPIRRQLLGDISSNCFKYYVPDESMVPLKSMWLGAGAGESAY
ncbi:phytanoyl-CoA dioxygenase family protein [Paenibacillus sacheonensis]|uniref:Phytanoyl-CoA dioxygenase n=1 Tax=Paenibacillus sacheonensis TaxID=742054 RepID=A0A7X4YSY5_9BACL|nr:phytanoyl-CoA dioxygenase family protein [Paenibacillus sacheonensis]MBM7567745.1 ectoine hydroxylase-related dioxygenase (phytanoyl-CoA dioxygenase family) [Paenibacillus sacheonensis]NBC71981.1 phytanoyl-CoA dioxygenase [Paenibacillus sacheonensis]